MSEREPQQNPDMDCCGGSMPTVVRPVPRCKESEQEQAPPLLSREQDNCGFPSRIQWIGVGFRPAAGLYLVNEHDGRNSTEASVVIPAEGEGGRVDLGEVTLQPPSDAEGGSVRPFASADDFRPRCAEEPMDCLVAGGIAAVAPGFPRFTPVWDRPVTLRR
jgi:hypothetical protein